MNLAIRGMVDAKLGDRSGDTFHEDLHPDLRADFILANPPFNDSQWHGELLKEDPRWAYGIPPASNANYAWIQHFIHHLAPDGIAGFVLANGASRPAPMERTRSARSSSRPVWSTASSLCRRNCSMGRRSLFPYGSSRRADPEEGGSAIAAARLFVDAQKIGAMVTRNVKALARRTSRR